MNTQHPNDGKKELSLSGRFTRDLEIVKQYPHLEKLFLADFPYDVDFSVLKELKDLRELNIGRGWNLTSLERILSNVPELDSLRIYYPITSDDLIDAISEIRNLKILFIQVKNRRLDISSLEKCTNLVELGLKSLSGKQKFDFEFLRSLTQLRILNLEQCYTRPIDLSPLSHCKELQVLNLGRNLLESLTLDPLSSCKKLGILKLNENRLSEIDLSPLSSCVELRRINLSFNQLEKIDLSPLAQCTDLNHLFLYSNRLMSIDLDPLREVDLERILLRKNRLISIRMPTKSSWLNLKKLGLADNKLTEIDLSSLFDCKILSDIDLSQNKFENLDLSPLAGCQHLENLDLRENPLVEVDLSPIHTSLWVDIGITEYGDKKGGMKQRGGTVWKAHIHPKSVHELWWPEACIGCGTKEDPLKKEMYDWKIDGQFDVNVSNFQKIAIIKNGEKIVGKLYLMPSVFYGGLGILSSMWQGTKTTFWTRFSIFHCPRCIDIDTSSGTHLDIHLQEDIPCKQLQFTITFSSQEYTNLFKQRNRLMQFNS